MANEKKYLPPIHPGEILDLELLLQSFEMPSCFVTFGHAGILNCKSIFSEVNP